MNAGIVPRAGSLEIGLQIAERQLRLQDRVGLEGDAEADALPVALPVDAVVVLVLIVEPAREDALDERRQRAGDLIADADAALEKGVVAVALIDGFAVRFAVLVDRVLGKAAEGEHGAAFAPGEDGKAIDIVDAGRAGDPHGEVRVGQALRVEVVALGKIELPALAEIEALGGIDVGGRTIVGAVVRVGEVGAAREERRFVARPVRLDQDLRRDLAEGRGLAARGRGGVAGEAAADLDRRVEEEAAEPDPDRAQRGRRRR